MGVKVIKLDDVQISVILTGLSLAHRLYNDKDDKDSMILCDELIGLIDDSDIYIGDTKHEKK